MYLLNCLAIPSATPPISPPISRPVGRGMLLQQILSKQSSTVTPPISAMSQLSVKPPSDTSPRQTTPTGLRSRQSPITAPPTISRTPPTTITKSPPTTLKESVPHTTLSIQEKQGSSGKRLYIL